MIFHNFHIRFHYLYVLSAIMQSTVMDINYLKRAYKSLFVIIFEKRLI